MNVDNFVVRPHRRLVERFREPRRGRTLDVGDLSELADRRRRASRPSWRPSRRRRSASTCCCCHSSWRCCAPSPGSPAAGAGPRRSPGCSRSTRPSPPSPASSTLIAEVQTDEWWADVTLPMLETVRTAPAAARAVHRAEQARAVYTDFEDQIGEARRGRVRRAGGCRRLRAVPPQGPQRSWPSTRRTPSIEKIHQQLADHRRTTSPSCSASSSRAASAPPTTCEHAVEEAGSLGLFIRRLVGLDRAAAKEAFGEFLDDKRYTANQIEFVNLVIDELTEHGVIEPRRFYESPFTDVSPHGPDALFESDDVDRLIAAVDDVRSRAEAA